MALREQEKRAFEELVEDFGGGDFPPVEEPPFDRGPRGFGLPVWSVAVGSFLIGAIVSNLILFAPLFAPVVVLMVVLGYVAVAVIRRWT